ncbi:HNH endonuclease [Massilimicrobiota sp. An142]|uniref:HNH endonuclease domain-containing protein n=1 Tax=unclassified Massilimicrobiota TaxID=2619866 RepID=UPI000B37B3B8|nr:MULTISPECIES: HNH endonuclease domain-containing protein [unclassified Massilimicrobiota]OUQ13636.1 HNH endonuclease [Massilimicrobiota sp. An142]OUQ29536.1 HNH endonuclease [Massilimicrobiota sp. An134]
MSEYIKNWLDIIENMNNDNTYKLAWGRALLELIIELDVVQDVNVFSFQQIAVKMLKYYWNQIYFFQLKQSPAKKPIIVQETEKCISYVNQIRQMNNPIWFDLAEDYLKKDLEFYQKKINKIAITLKHDVSWRFKKVKDKTLEIYRIDLKQREIYFSKEEVIDLKEYAFILSQLLNYRWAQLLEKFNNSPKISLKVKGISDEKIRRNNLTKFKNILLEQMKDGKIIDFYTGDILEENDISVDHVIPWSFMYSDDIWNLVITSKSMNSRKSNTIPDEKTIKRLENRNKELIKAIDYGTIYYNDLKQAIENNYVQKFYVSCKM